MPVIRIFSLIAVAALFCTPTAARSQAPEYVQRLTLPVARDDIGYGQSVTVDHHTGEIFVSDPRTNRILIFDKDGFFKFQILGGTEFSGPRDLAVDPDGLILVLGSRGGRPLPIELDFDGVFRREIPILGVDTELSKPRLNSIALSPDGTRVFLIDDADLRLLIADRDGNLKKSIDLAANFDKKTRTDVFAGQVDVYGDRVLVPISSHGEVRKFDLDGNQVDSIGLKGTGRCELGRPTAAALTNENEYLIVDQQRMLLLRWSATGNRCLGEYIGIGAAPGYLYYPFDVALDANGRLYIAQSFDGRVQVYKGLRGALGSTDN